VALLALAAALLRPAASEALCPGGTRLGGHGAVEIVPTGWERVAVSPEGEVVPRMDSRAYFADSCEAGRFDNTQYLALNLLAKTFRYTVDLNGAGCGCNAALYLTSMYQNMNKSTCGDYYCDANAVCGVRCAEIDIQEANLYSWHSTLHAAADNSGLGEGIGGGGSMWNGPRDISKSDYGPGARCVDTNWPFAVATSFPVDASGDLSSMDVVLSQQGSPCNLTMSVGGYKGMQELSEALRAGMTPIVSYWSSNNMLWLDGPGKDHRGPCPTDNATKCSDHVKFYDFNIEKYERPVQEEVVTDAVEEVVPFAAPAQASDPMSRLRTVFFGAASSVETVNDICHSYIVETGCRWTKDYSCPDQKPGAKGNARDDGGVGYKCCCSFDMWTQQVETAAEIREADKKELPKLCSASYGTEVGERTCCGQSGFVNSKDQVCSQEAPTCIGYVQGSIWGTCQVAEPWQQCGGKRRGEDWWGPTSCTLGWACSHFTQDYAQCVKEGDTHYIMMKSAVFRAMGALAVEGRPEPARLLAAASALLVLMASLSMVLTRWRRRSNSHVLLQSQDHLSDEPGDDV